MAILAAVDGERTSNSVVTVGHDLAKAYGDTLVVLHVMEQDHFDAIRKRTSEDRTKLSSGDAGLPFIQYGTGSNADGYFLDQAVEDAASVAADVVEGALEHARNVETVGRVGDVTTEVVDEAVDRNARYIVVGGRKRSPAGKALFGSTTQSVLLTADRPVVTVMHDR